MEALKALKPGDHLPSIQCPPVSRLDLIKYAGASGDYNPIHTIDDEAIKAGLPGIIAHGMWTMGHLSRIVTPYLDEGYVRSYSVRFHSMVFLGDKITLEGDLKEVTGNAYTFDVKAVKQNGETVVKGYIVLEKF